MDVNSELRGGFTLVTLVNIEAMNTGCIRSASLADNRPLLSVMPMSAGGRNGKNTEHVQRICGILELQKVHWVRYLRMLLHPCLEFHEDVMAKGVAPTLLFAWTALHDC